jgi:predicted ATPase
VSDSEIPVVGLDGSGLATALKELKANDEARFDAFRTAVRQVIPLVEDFRFARRKRLETRARHIRVEDQMVEVPQPHTVILDELLIRFAGTGFVPARAASEGTLITLALLAALFTTQSVSRLLLIDDLDQGLHIEAQDQLVQALRRILEQQPEVQIIATAHSPYLVDHFSPDEVVVLRRTDVGQPIQATRLSEHPDTVLREFKTGEALVATGKDWFG